MSLLQLVRKWLYCCSKQGFVKRQVISSMAPDTWFCPSVFSLSFAWDALVKEPISYSIPALNLRYYYFTWDWHLFILNVNWAGITPSQSARVPDQGILYLLWQQSFHCPSVLPWHDEVSVWRGRWEVNKWSNVMSLTGVKKKSRVQQNDHFSVHVSP